jgi:hypothetical protein
MDTGRAEPPLGTAPALGPPDVHSQEHRVRRAAGTLLPISCASSPSRSAITRCGLVRHAARRSREDDTFSQTHPLQWTRSICSADARASVL